MNRTRYGHEDGRPIEMKMGELRITKRGRSPVKEAVGYSYEMDPTECAG